MYKRFFLKTADTALQYTPISGIYGASLAVVRNEFVSSYFAFILNFTRTGGLYGASLAIVRMKFVRSYIANNLNFKQRIMQTPFFWKQLILLQQVPLYVCFMVLALQSLKMNLWSVTLLSFSILSNVLCKRFSLKTADTALMGTPISGVYGASLAIVIN